MSIPKNVKGHFQMSADEMFTSVLNSLLLAAALSSFLCGLKGKTQQKALSPSSQNSAFYIVEIRFEIRQPLNSVLIKLVGSFCQYWYNLNLPKKKKWFFCLIRCAPNMPRCPNCLEVSLHPPILPFSPRVHAASEQSKYSKVIFRQWAHRTVRLCFRLKGRVRQGATAGLVICGLSWSQSVVKALEWIVGGGAFGSTPIGLC